MMASAEEAIDSRKRKNNLNLFFRDSKKFADHGADDSENKGQRNSSTNVVVSSILLLVRFYLQFFTLHCSHICYQLY